MYEKKIEERRLHWLVLIVKSEKKPIRIKVSQIKIEKNTNKKNPKNNQENGR